VNRSRETEQRSRPAPLARAARRAAPPERSAPAGRRRAGDGGFTFIEILVAMMIVFILLGSAGFVYFRYVARARVVAAKDQIPVFELALNSYLTDSGAYPTPEQGLKALWEKPILEPVPRSWDGPYLTKEVPKDPWGHDWVYRVPGPNNLPFAIISYGSDGAEGGEGDAADIVSWRN
jgi:general secretion pathway protein G